MSKNRRKFSSEEKYKDMRLKETLLKTLSARKWQLVIIGLISCIAMYGIKSRASIIYVLNDP